MSRRPQNRARPNPRVRSQAPPEPSPQPDPPPQPEPDNQPSDEEREPGDWRPSRPVSPPQRPDDISEGSEITNRPVRPEPTSRYANLNYWKARRVTFYRNGDPFHPGVEFRFKPGRDLVSLDVLLDRLSERLELPRGARFIFGMDGDRKYRLEELEDGASYVVSSYKTFKGPDRRHPGQDQCFGQYLQWICKEETPFYHHVAQRNTRSKSVVPGLCLVLAEMIGSLPAQRGQSHTG
ncbi:unnamed protein product [Diatraea saccharalis]|uniref:Doublecortin domain-containing protein n=1 Tax=Diatraea saccharalis TaxID=40085 RepID=A0A9N9W7Q6_9NEOP|nr:unnamed protein product [Diatraea saccharalis]